MKKLFSLKKTSWGTIFFAVFCALILALSIRGIGGNPTPPELNRVIWKDNGPLELSPERGRYALMYSIAEFHSFAFTPDLARFAAPDVAYTNGHYASLFAPALSFLIVPGYFIGKFFNLAQVGSFAVISLFALFNVFLIRAIAMRLGANSIAGFIGGLTFLFATPAFAYAVTLYQHHISTFIILSSIYLLIRFKSIWSLIAIWMLCAFSISVDYPNFFLMLPIGFAALGKTFVADKLAGKVVFHISLLRLLTIATMVIPLAFFLWFNAVSNGSPLQLSGTLERSIEVKADGSPLLESQVYKKQLKAAGRPVVLPQKTATGAFQSRLLLNGFYIHFLSPDRGILLYTPVMLFGIGGLLWAIKRKVKHIGLFVAVIGFNILLYSMWDDPYGGWAFGSRYLIPTYALLSIFIAYTLTRLSKSVLFLLFFFIWFSYSIGVNTLGAITSNRNPPKVEAVALSNLTHQREPYTYERNVDLLNNDISKSYIFETYAANTITAWNYYLFLVTFLILTGGLLVVFLHIFVKGGRHAV
jgi:hypothetical protein